jgi:hypothetical protein
MFLVLLFASKIDAARISASSAGFADSTAGFWRIEYSGDQSDHAAIASVTLRMPGPGFFDFDGFGNYAGQTAPIFDDVSSFGLNAAEVSFEFSGVHPSEITLQFAPGSFTQGDRVHFTADIDGLGSNLGGALGAYEGLEMSVVLTDGRAGSARFTTDTSVSSGASLEISPAAIPEPGTFPLVCAAVVALYASCSFRQWWVRVWKANSS